MAKNAEKTLEDITQCCICLQQCTNPRMLPCIHTFCLECLIKTGESTKKKPGESLPCPLCRKEFVIPDEGMKGLRKNFFLENLIEMIKVAELGRSSNACDICKTLNEDTANKTPEAKMRCLECQQNYCDRCSATHKLLTVSKSHHLAEIGSKTELIKRVAIKRHCSTHMQRELDFYCMECKKLVCVACVVESHSSHGCKDVTTVEEQFRQTLDKNVSKLSDYVEDKFSKLKRIEKSKVDFLNNVLEVEKLIFQKNKELKEMIEKETKRLLEELSSIKENHLKQIQIEMEEIETGCTLIKNMEVYCSELISKGSASDICGSFDEILKRIDKIGEDHEAVLDRPSKSVRVSFTPENMTTNLLGKIQEEPKDNINEYKNCAFVVGMSNGSTITKEVVKIDLRNPKQISFLSEISTPTMQLEASAAVYRNTVFVTGIGNNKNEIWKYVSASGWKQCASLIKGRRRHSVAFVDEVLYVCGGFVDSDGSILNSVEAYNAKIDVCKTVGKLVYGVQSAGNCVPINGALYIFGGSDKDNTAVCHVQIYDTKLDTCTLLFTPMPIAFYLLRAVLWDKLVILLGNNTCFLFNFEMETWEVRKEFKTDVIHFGLALENGRIFIFGGGNSETDAEGKTKWKCRDDIRYIPIVNIIENNPIEWKLYGRLPKPAFVSAYGHLKSRST